MSNSKDKRIKKLKKKRIWPSIVGLFFITLIFGIILVAQLGINILNVTQNKVATGVEQTEVIAKLFEEYEGENQQTIQDSVSIYIDIMPEVEAVWVSDLDDNIVWANSDMKPNVENVAELSFDGEQSISLILEEDFEQGITIRDNEIVFCSRYLQGREKG